MITYVDLNAAKTRDRVYEKLDSKSFTEQAGYIPPKDQIESMILAGRRLDDHRKSLYDFDSEEDIDEEAYDPTRSGNFDLADASQVNYSVQQRLREQVIKGSQTAQEGSEKPKPVLEGVDIPPPEKGA